MQLFTPAPALVALHQGAFLATLALAPAWTEAQVVRSSLSGHSSTLDRGANVRLLNLAAAYLQRHPGTAHAARLAEDLLRDQHWFRPQPLASLLASVYLAAPEHGGLLLDQMRKKAHLQADRPGESARELRRALCEIALTRHRPAGKLAGALERLLNRARKSRTLDLEVALPVAQSDEGAALQLSAVARAMGRAVERQTGLKVRVEAATSTRAVRRGLRLSPSIPGPAPYRPLAQVSEAPGRWRAMDLSLSIIEPGEPDQRALVQGGWQPASPEKPLWSLTWTRGPHTGGFQQGARILALRGLWTLFHQ